MNMDVKTMTGGNGRIFRCAAYVRKSTEDGLEQEYNSLDAQYDAIKSYVRSQSYNGWQLIDKKYSDGGYSGGSQDRPALNALKADIEAGLIDIVVVYKIDRLSRSITDFADLSRLFDRHHVSFVSVTQQIDTSNAAGRMLLNILISFSQFEREMAADRIRDKMRATKAKGMWVGGNVPFGYKVEDKKLVVNPSTEPQARRVFELYAKYGELRKVCRALRDEGIERAPGKPWRPRSVYNAVHNRRYIAEMVVDGKIIQADHASIIDRTLWDRVQKIIVEHPRHDNPGRTPLPQASLLRDILFCGNCKSKMTYSWCRSSKNAAKRYGYYQCQRQQRVGEGCSVKRVPSALVEAEVARALCKVLSASLSLVTSVAGVAMVPTNRLLAALASNEGVYSEFNAQEQQDVLRAAIARINVYENRLEVLFKTYGVKDLDSAALGFMDGDILHVNVSVMFRNVSGIRRVFHLDNESRPITASALTDNPLLTSVVRAFAWLKLLDEGKVRSIPELCKLTNMEPHFMYRTLRLATLSPKVIRTIISGKEPDGLSLGKIRTLTTDDWSEQERILGVPL